MTNLLEIGQIHLRELICGGFDSLDRRHFHLPITIDLAQCISKRVCRRLTHHYFSLQRSSERSQICTSSFFLPLALMSELQLRYPIQRS